MTTQRQFIIFTLKDEEFGIDVDDVREILKLPKIHSLPQSLGFIEGVINLRKHIVAVIDLRKRLGIETASHSEKSRILIVKVKDIVVGLIVDVVLEIISVSSEFIEPPPQIVTPQISAKYIQGISRVKERVIVFLDVKELLTSKNIGELVKANRRIPDSSNQ
ncbi:chemotaxis protein CheW [Candidatus Omnitrophota bacterium]